MIRPYDLPESIHRQSCPPFRDPLSIEACERLAVPADDEEDEGDDLDDEDDEDLDDEFDEEDDENGDEEDEDDEDADLDEEP